MAVFTPKIIGLTSFNTENLNIDNNSITAYNSSIEQVSYTDLSENQITQSENLGSAIYGLLSSATMTNAQAASPTGTNTAWQLDIYSR